MKCLFNDSHRTIYSMSFVREIILFYAPENAPPAQMYIE